MLIAQRINKVFSLLKIKRNDINNKTQYFLFIWLFIHCLCGKIYWNSFCFRLHSSEEVYRSRCKRKNRKNINLIDISGN